MKFTRAAGKRRTNSFAHPENGGIPVESGPGVISDQSYVSYVILILMFDSLRDRKDPFC
jgi:hypothetical protein